jgi:hypothetical protein
MLVFIKRWWPTILTAVGALWAAFGPQIQAVVASHPKLSSVLGLILAIATHMLPSPVASSTKSGDIVSKIYAPAK